MGKWENSQSEFIVFYNLYAISPTSSAMCVCVFLCSIIWPFRTNTSDSAMFLLSQSLSLSSSDAANAMAPNGTLFHLSTTQSYPSYALVAHTHTHKVHYPSCGICTNVVYMRTTNISYKTTTEVDNPSEDLAF